MPNHPPQSAPSAPEGLTELPIRLAIRQEGDMVNAYLADDTTMEGALWLGSIRRGLCDRYPELFCAWKQLMTIALGRMVEVTLGQSPTMIERPAPERERSGRA